MILDVSLLDETAQRWQPEQQRDRPTSRREEEEPPKNAAPRRRRRDDSEEKDEVLRPAPFGRPRV